jgi:shikimate dehydrogenase
MVTISGKAILAGVLGWPIGHTKSPLLHNFWFERYGIDGAYVPLGVNPVDLVSVLSALPKMGFRGVNVTLPHKEAVIPLVDALDPLAAEIGAVNTVLIDQHGKLLGLNTDGIGFLAHLSAAVPGWRDDVRRVFLIGAGGAARALAATFIAAGVEELCLVNRTVERAEQLLARLASGTTCTEARPWPERHAALAGTDLLVNTSSLGMTGQPPLDLALDRLQPKAIVADIVYAPLTTPLLQDAARRGHRTVDGLGMLLHQAVPGFTHWGGIEPAVDRATRAVVEAALAAGR